MDISGYHTNWCFLLRISFSSYALFWGQLVHFYMYRKIALSLCFTLFLGLLSGCNPKSVLHLDKSESANQTSSKNSQNQNTTSEPTAVSPPSTENLLAKDNDGITAPVALPPSYGGSPQKPGQSGTAYMPNGLPVLQPMKGVNVDALFSEEIRDSDERFDRVENAVVELRKEFESLKPSMVRLAAVETDIQSLVTELEVLLQETPPTQTPTQLMPQYQRPEDQANLTVSQLATDPDPPPQVGEPKGNTSPPPMAKPPAKEVKKPAPTTPKSKAPVKAYDGVVATNLRIGEHSDKVRVVIDTNVKTNFTIDHDKEENLITVELPDARWVGDLQETLRDSKLVKSWSVTSINDDKGSLVVMTLKKPSSIMQQKRLAPDSHPYHRIYFDLSL
mgnify:CR=1 FL=1